MYWIVALGIAAGCSTMTPLAVLCWFAYTGALTVSDSPIAWTGTLTAVILFSLCAVGEYIVDTLPQTPSRTKPALVLGRLAMGIFVGCLIASLLTQPLAGGVLFGGIGALIGTYGGYRVRMAGARLFGRDLPMALLESAYVIGLAVLALRHIHEDMLKIARHVGI